MKKISLLEFFRTGSFGGVRVGDTKKKVRSILGEPEDYIFGLDKPSKNIEDAGIWFFAGVQFLFSEDNELVEDIGFKPFYLHPTSQYRHLDTEHTSLDSWIFSSEQEPIINELKLALHEESIQFRDTGLEGLVYDERIKNFKAVSYQPESEYDEVFGTLVLKSGVQIRYDKDGAILRVAGSKNMWTVYGKEQTISW